MGRHNWRDQQGAVGALVGILLAVLMGFIGLALDVANLTLNRTQMKKAANAAVLAGALSLPNQEQATSQAHTFLTSNNFNPAAAAIDFAVDAVNNPSGSPEINVTLTKTVPMYFMSVLGFPAKTITVRAEAFLSSNSGGPFNYTIFSNKPLKLTGAVNVEGSIHSNEDTRISGSVNVDGSVEGAEGVWVSGAYNISGTAMADTVSNVRLTGAGHVGGTAGGAQSIAMPDFSAQIASVAVQTFTGDQHFSGTVNYSGSIFVNGNVKITGAVNFTGAILATGDIMVTGAANITGANQVCLYSSGGDVKLSGAANFGTGSSSVIVYAPNGEIKVSGATNLNGRLAGDKVTYSGAANVNGEDYPVTSLPAVNPTAKLIS